LDPNYKLLDEMYQDNYYPAFQVTRRRRTEKVNDLLEGSAKPQPKRLQETLDEALRYHDHPVGFDENDSGSKLWHGNHFANVDLQSDVHIPD
jgi:hypothetical protein